MTQLSVLFLVPRSKNPYQTLLTGALEACGVQVKTAPPQGSFPVWSGASGHGWPPIVHLHWAHPLIERTVPMLRWASRPFAALAGARTLAEVSWLKRRGIKFVWTIHNLVSHDARHAAIETAFNRRLAQMCDRLIVHYPEAAQLVRGTYQLGRHHPIDVVEHAHYCDYYPDYVGREEAKEKLGIRPGETAFLFLGAIRPYKEVGRLLDAFGQIERPDVRLIIAGKLSRSDERAFTSLLSGDSRVVIRAGFVPDDEIQVYMRAADAVVQPASDILTSGSAILAMSFGKPIVAADTPHLRFLVGNGGGVLYDPCSTSALREALERALLADLSAMGRLNAHRIAHASWTRMAAQTRDVYEKALLQETR
jgi:beta-1,4-mannosyltransferase